MRGLVLLVFALSVALAGVATPAVTNAVSGVASFSTATNAPACLPSEASIASIRRGEAELPKAGNSAVQGGCSGGKVLRQRCEAVTKSGNRCKRNAVSGGKLCRQHEKIRHRNP